MPTEPGMESSRGSRLHDLLVGERCLEELASDSVSDTEPADPTFRGARQANADDNLDIGRRPAARRHHGTCDRPELESWQRMGCRRAHGAFLGIRC